MKRITSPELKAIAELPPLEIDIDVVALLRESRDQR